MDNAIGIPKEHTITFDGYDGFKIVVPNGTPVLSLHHFLGRALSWTLFVLQSSAPKKEEPKIKRNWLQRLFAANAAHQ